MLRYLKNKLKSIFCLHEWESESKVDGIFVCFKCKKCGSKKFIKERDNND